MTAWLTERSERKAFAGIYPAEGGTKLISRNKTKEEK